MSLKYRTYFRELPIYNRVLVLWFSMFYAIPNKVFVNNQIRKYIITLSIFFILIISHLFPPFILLYIIFWVLVLESYVFAVFYESNPFFRSHINKNLFNGDSLFAKEYFGFFWGNMTSGGSGAKKAGVVGSVLGSLFAIARNSEKTHVRVQGQIEVQNHINKTGRRPETFEESFMIQKKMENHVLERDTIILKVENRIQEFGTKAFEWFTGS